MAVYFTRDANPEALYKWGMGAWHWDREKKDWVPSLTLTPDAIEFTPISEEEARSLAPEAFKE